MAPSGGSHSGRPRTSLHTVLASPARHPSRAWALAGALWGLASVLPTVFPHAYFQLLGYPLARILRWLLPAWYAVLALAPASRVTTAIPAWAFGGLIGLISVALGATVAFVLGRLTRQLHYRASPPRL